MKYFQCEIGKIFVQSCFTIQKSSMTLNVCGYLKWFWVILQNNECIMIFDDSNNQNPITHK